MSISFIKNTVTVMSLLLLSALVSSAYGAKRVKVAPLAEDLQALIVEAEALDTQLAGITLTDTNLCSELLSAHQSSDALIGSIESVSSALSSPITLDDDSLQALDDLSTVITSIASNSTGLSSDLTSLDRTTDMLQISAGITAMLKLADDIGTMADRILEMSDKILVMADNIGLMADRIITTQLIQSDNLALTQSSILTTQSNALLLVNTTNTNTYTIELNSEILTGNLLSGDIAATVLTQFTMASQWSSMASDVDSLKSQIDTTYNVINTASASNTMYIDADSYTSLAEMSLMVSSLAIAMEGKTILTEALSSTTSDSTLTASTASILEMSADINVMANRILEMADLILAMADNIGLAADQIIATQALQSTNYAVTLASVETTQTAAVTIIAINAL